MSAWVTGTTYRVLDSVTYNGETYLAKVEFISSVAPDTDTANWQLLLTSGTGSGGTGGTVITAMGILKGDGSTVSSATTADVLSLLGATTVTGSNTGDQVIPTTLPASDVYAWAKAATKPSYTAAEISGLSGTNTGDETATTIKTKLGIEALTGLLKLTAGTPSVAVSGTDLKTVNGVSLLGSGDVAVSGGSSFPVTVSTTPPTAGQVLTAMSGSAASWQTPSAGASLSQLTITAVGQTLPILYFVTEPPVLAVDSVSASFTGKWVFSLAVYDAFISSFTATDLEGTLAGITFSTSTPFRNLTDVSFPALTNSAGVFFSNMPVLTTISLPNLINVTGTLSVGTVASLTSFNVPSLQRTASIQLTGVTTASGITVSFSSLAYVTAQFYLNSITNLSSISLPSLVSCGQFNFTSVGGLTTFSCPVLTSISQFDITSFSALTFVSAPNLVKVASRFLIQSSPALTTVTLTSLATVGGKFQISQGVLVSLYLPALVSVGEGLVINVTSGLTTVNLPSIVSIKSDMNFNGNTSLANFTLGATLKELPTTVGISGCALTQASVDNILARVAALDGTNGTVAFGTGCTLSLQGTPGVNATPSTAGSANKAIIVARGAIVTTN